jgi:hypothetical protein
LNSLEKYIKQNSLQFNRPALVLGSAPTVKIVSKIKFDGIRIGVGDMPVRAKRLGPYDYWVTANTYYPLPWVAKDRREIEQSNAITLISSMSVVHSRETKENIYLSLEDISTSQQFVLYNQKHFDRNDCREKDFCCQVSQYLVKGLSIQEILGQESGLNAPAYGEGSTVALHGYALAVLLKANPIYLSGIELPIQYKDYRAYKNLFRPNEKIHSKIKRVFKDYIYVSRKRRTDFGEAGQKSILHDFQSIALIAEKLGIKTYSLSELSPLNQVDGIAYLNLSASPNGSTSVNN